MNLLLDRKIINQAQAGNGRVLGSSEPSLFFLKATARRSQPAPAALGAHPAPGPRSHRAACRGNPSVGFHISAPVSPCSKKTRRSRRRRRGGSAAWVLFSWSFRLAAERGEKFREYDIPQAASGIKRRSAASGGQPPPPAAPAPPALGAETLQRIHFAG